MGGSLAVPSAAALPGASRFAAYWVSRHGGLRVFLGMGTTRDATQLEARRRVVEQGFEVGSGNRILISPLFPRASDDAAVPTPAIERKAS
jgi:hypothetical protein